MAGRWPSPLWPNSVYRNRLCLDCHASQRSQCFRAKKQHLSNRSIGQPSSSSCIVPCVGNSLLPCTCLSAQHASSACCQKYKAISCLHCSAQGRRSPSQAPAGGPVCDQRAGAQAAPRQRLAGESVPRGPAWLWAVGYACHQKLPAGSSSPCSAWLMRSALQPGCYLWLAWPWHQSTTPFAWA